MMEPLCVALASALESAGKAYCQRPSQPEPSVVALAPPQRSPETSTAVLAFANAFWTQECDLTAIDFASPIEMKMAYALAERRGNYGLRMVGQSGLTYETCRTLAKAALPCISSGAAVFPHVTIGPYELDFLLLFRNSGGELLAMAVECDGHDFHEKTKKQAARDKKRDRYIAVHSIIMLRFTGSEIHYGAHTCAEEVNRAMLFVQAGPREKVWRGYLSEAAQRDMEVMEAEDEWFRAADEEWKRGAEKEAQEEEENRRLLQESEGYYP